MKAIFKIYRYDISQNKDPYYKDYEVDVESNSILLDVLNDIKFWFHIMS